ncbi:PTS N-acetylglucosamine transporter subunit IIBC [Lactobacillus sp. CC-MHH1034]|uniref:PTS sugar transporter subunit IIA n=1 Tax=Agrilactobacillus fermenti TaxID=2586909 RepID=UPI001E33A081|nr:PTS N-acetylglucosamine transporter subunit IIBC [Agrilactobacillus fermenti]MCD2256903.1 PTS N-acetylglucosamine transporter subunit IIBC [Agrilactobacillus fermenti]
MKRKIVLASHHQLAAGLADTLKFIAGDMANEMVITLTTYMDNQPVEAQVQKVMATFPEDTEVVVLTDMMAGSVNQKFFGYRTRPHTHIVSDMNLPLALAFTMESTAQYISSDRVRQIVAEAKDAIVYINEFQPDEDDDDE